MAAPLGGLLYQQENFADQFAAASETDSFTLNLDANQTATILFEPLDASLQARLTVLDPGSSTLATADAGGAGQRVLLQTVPLANEGLYQIDVTSLTGSGDYELSFYLNAMLDEEIDGGGGNDSVATAQSILGSQVPLPGAADRLAVRGTIDIRAVLSGEAYSLDAFENRLCQIDLADGATLSCVAVEAPNETVRWMNGLAQDPTTGEIWALASLEGREDQRDLIKIDPTTGIAVDIGVTGDNFAAIAFDDSGALYGVTGDGATTPETLYTLSKTNGTPTLSMPLGNGDGGETLAYNPQDGLLYHGSGQDNEVWETIDLASGSITGTSLSGESFDAFRGLGYLLEDRFLLSDGEQLYQLTTTGQVDWVGPLDHWSKGFVTTQAAITHVTDPADVYSFALLANQAATLVLGGAGGESAVLELLDANGQTLALGSSDSTNAALVIDDFVAPADGTYFARIRAEQYTDYNLVVTRDASFEAEPNDVAIGAGDISLTGSALGHLGTAGSRPIQVAVLDDSTYRYGDQIVEQLNDDTHFDFAAERVINASIDTIAELSKYDVLVLGHSSMTIDGDTAIAIQDWYQQGLGGVVGTASLYSNLQNASAAVRPVIDTVVPLDMSMSNGRISALYVTVVDHSHPVTMGLVDFYYYSGESSDNGADVGATVLASDGAEGAPTVIVREDGAARGVWLTTGYFSTTSTSSLRAGPADRLLEQVVAWAASDRADQYLLRVNAGDSLSIETTTPGDGPGEPGNSLDPWIELFDENGILVAADDDSGSGNNARLTWDVPMGGAGAYRVAVRPTSGAGPYTLVAEGATGMTPPLEVSQTSPADGATDTGFPAYRVTFSESILLSSVAAEDLQVDGQPADSVMVIDDRTIEFDLTSANHGDGTYHVSMTADAVTSVSGSQLLPFAATFQADVLPPLQPVQPLGSLIYDPPGTGHFSATADVDTFNLTLDAGQTVTVVLTPRDASIQGQIELFAPGGASLGLATSAATGQAAILQTVAIGAAGSYRLDATSLAGAGAYQLQVILNAATEEEDCLSVSNNDTAHAQFIDGSAVAVGVGADRLGLVGRVAGDADFFAFSLAAGQYASLSLAAADGGTLGLQLLDDTGTLLAIGSSAAFNDAQRITGFVAPSDDVFYARVTGDPDTRYTLLVTRDIDFEQELNDTSAAAQDISFTRQALGFAGYLEYQELVLADRPVAYWRMGETGGTQMVDTAGGMHDGVYNNDVVLGVPGAIASDADTAIGLDGDDDFALVPDSEALRPAQLTVEGWIYADDRIERGDAVLSKTDANFSTGYALWFDGYPTSPSVGFFVDSWESVSAPITLNRWTHVAGTYDGSTIRIFVDGVEIDSLAFSGPIDHNTAPLRFGYDDEFHNWDVWSGWIDEFAIYDKALSSDRIHARAAANLSSDADFYRVQVSADDSLIVATTTPGDGGGEWTNTLDPFLALYNESGQLVASVDNSPPDNRNAVLHYTVPPDSSGSYRIAVGSVAGVGEYTVSIEGATGGRLPFDVIATTPDGAAVVPQFPDTIQVDFSSSLLLSSVDASDLTINGASADAVMVVDEDTLAFAVASAHDGDGMYDLEISAGSIISLSDQPLEAFSLTLDIDTTSPMTRIDPPGSLIYQTAGDGFLDTVGDVDTFTFALDPEQVISFGLLPADGSFQAQLQLFDPDDHLLGTVTAASVGQAVTLQQVAVSQAGVYRLEATSLSGQGHYDLPVLLNAVGEEEQFGGAANDTIATAQMIDGSAVDLQPPADRLAVVGRWADSSDADLYGFQLADDQLATFTLVSGEGDVGSSLELMDAGGALLSVGIQQLDARVHRIDQFLAAAGTYYLRVTGSDASRYSLLVTRGADFEVEPNTLPEGAQSIDPAAQVHGFVPPAIPDVEPDDFDDGDRDTLIVSSGLSFSVEGQPGEVVVSASSSYASTGDRNFQHREATEGYASDDFTFNYPLRVDFYGNVSRVSMDFIGTRSTTQVGLLRAYDAAGNLIAQTNSDPLARYQAQAVTVASADRHIAYVLASGDGYATPALDNLRILSQGLDYFAFDAMEGDQLVLRTTTPVGGPLEFANSLDPSLTLLDPSGGQVAYDDDGSDGLRNASIEYTVPAGQSGTYRVMVAAGTTTGEYTLAIDGATSATSPLTVLSVPHDPGEIVAFFPAAYQIEFSDSVLLSTLGAEDLRVNGAPADAVTVVDGDTLVFDLSSAESGDGLYTIHLPAASLNSLLGSPVAEFTSQFIFDTVSPTVAATSVSEGQVVTQSDLIVEVIFSETMATEDLGAEDVMLVETYSSTVIPSGGFAYDPATDMATLTYDGLPDGLYQLTLSSGAAAFRDVAGRALDGAGDEGSSDFQLNFVVDTAQNVYPTPLESKLPHAAWVYDPVATQFFHEAGDVDPLTIDLDAGQTATVLLTTQDATLRGQLELLAPDGSRSAVASAAAAGDSVLLQTVPVATAGTYQIEATSLVGAGSYEVQLILNAALEEESTGGPTNDDPASAQAIAGSLLPLPENAARLALLGSLADETDVDLFVVSLQDQQPTTLTLVSQIEFTEASALSLELLDENGILVTMGLEQQSGQQGIRQVLLSAGDYFARVSGTAGMDYALVVTGGADLQRGFPVTAEQAQWMDPATIVLAASAWEIPSVEPDDYFAFHADEGDVLVVQTMTPGDGGGEPVNDFDPQIQLFNDEGLFVVEDDNSAVDGRNARVGYTVPTGGEGDYVVRVGGSGRGPYTLQVIGATPGDEPAPHVTETSPIEGQKLAVSPTSIDVILSEAVQADSLDVSDLILSSGASVSGVEMVDGATIRFWVSVPDVAGVYQYELVAGAFTDLQGQVSEPYTGTFEIDRTGPKVLEQIPSQQSVAPFTQWTFVFDEPINPATFTKADVFLFEDPAGADLRNQVTEVSGAGTTFTVAFSARQISGAYAISIGPDILDVAGNPMDQDGDGANGEPEDRFDGTLNLQSPDLKADSVTTLATANFGETIPIQWTVSNPENDAALETWSDSIWLSRDPFLSDHDILLGTFPAMGHSPLAAGDFYTQALSVSLPFTRDLSPDVYYVIGQADALAQQPELNESNNWIVSEPISLTLPPLPDLVVTSIEQRDGVHRCRLLGGWRLPVPGSVPRRGRCVAGRSREFELPGCRGQLQQQPGCPLAQRH
jgi:hypothetical protein